MTEHSVRERAADINWFHSIELEPGFVTPGYAVTRDRLELLKIPNDLTGKTVLDVGAWDGFFSFEAERRGAERVLATDDFAWTKTGWSSKAGFDLAREALGSHVEDAQIDVLDLDPEKLGRFDIVLCLGVLYHMRHPMLMLEKVMGVTGGTLILETHVDMTWTRRPAAAFYPGHELRLDPTNWWGPNPEAVTGMLHAVGFDHVEMVTPDSNAYRAARSVKRAAKYARSWAQDRARPHTHPAQGRAVFHATRPG